MATSRLLSFVLAVGFITLAGCVHSRSRIIAPAAYPPTAPSRVAILYQVPNRPYTVVAKLTVGGGRSTERAVLERELRQQAARLGAEAVIVDKRPVSAGYFGMWGRAVRWTGPARQRPIDW